MRADCKPGFPPPHQDCIRSPIAGRTLPITSVEQYSPLRDVRSFPPAHEASASARIAPRAVEFYAGWRPWRACYRHYEISSRSEPSPRGLHNSSIRDSSVENYDENSHSGRKKTAPALSGGRRCFLRAALRYFRLPLESIVMPPGPFSFLASFALRVPMALELHSFAAATSALTASGLP